MDTCNNIVWEGYDDFETPNPRLSPPTGGSQTANVVITGDSSGIVLQNTDVAPGAGTFFPFRYKNTLVDGFCPTSSASQLHLFCCAVARFEHERRGHLPSVAIPFTRFIHCTHIVVHYPHIFLHYILPRFCSWYSRYFWSYWCCTPQPMPPSPEPHVFMQSTERVTLADITLREQLSRNVHP